MSKNYTMSKFIKRNILDTISKKFNYDPVECECEDIDCERFTLKYAKENLVRKGVSDVS